MKGSVPTETGDAAAAATFRGYHEATLPAPGMGKQPGPGQRDLANGETAQ
jgi:hypothetical protein